MRRTTAFVGIVLVLMGLGMPGAADTSRFIALDVVTLANTVSRSMVPAGTAETAVLIVADDERAFAAPSLLGALPVHVPLLVTEGGELDDDVLEELDRATGRDESATVYAIGEAVDLAQPALESAGYTVIAFDGSDPTAVAAAAASGLFGAPAGTSQRVILVPAGDEVVAGIANALGIWLAIPVIPVTSSGFTTDAFIREVWAIGDFGGTPPPVTAPGPGIVRTFAAGDVFALALRLDELAGQEAGDSDPPTVVTQAPVVASTSGDTTTILVAATVAARRSLDGDRPPLLLVEGELDRDHEGRCNSATVDAATYCRLAAADGEVTFVGLATRAPEDRPDRSPLPATGAGLAAIGAVVVLSAFLRRRG